MTGVKVISFRTSPIGFLPFLEQTHSQVFLPRLGSTWSPEGNATLSQLCGQYLPFHPDTLWYFFIDKCSPLQSPWKLTMLCMGRRGVSVCLSVRSCSIKEVYKVLSKSRIHSICSKNLTRQMHRGILTFYCAILSNNFAIIIRSLKLKCII